jgi:hypothetical protein
LIRVGLEETAAVASIGLNCENLAVLQLQRAGEPAFLGLSFDPMRLDSDIAVTAIQQNAE